jgi:hypothetical protein
MWTKHSAGNKWSLDFGFDFNLSKRRVRRSWLRILSGVGAVFGVDTTGAVIFNKAVPGSSSQGVFVRARLCVYGAYRGECVEMEVMCLILLLAYSICEFTGDSSWIFFMFFVGD